MYPLKVRISRVNEQSNVPLPHYATEGSSGMDICAAVESDVLIQPGETVLVPSGFRMELPQGYEAQVRPRSGLALKHRVGILNAPGTIDSDYRGEVKVILTNFGSVAFIVRTGDRIAQLIISKYERIEWDEVASVNETTRGEGGFGHTGVVSTRGSQNAK